MFQKQTLHRDLARGKVLLCLLRRIQLWSICMAWQRVPSAALHKRDKLSSDESTAVEKYLQNHAGRRFPGLRRRSGTRLRRNPEYGKLQLRLFRAPPPAIQCAVCRRPCQPLQNRRTQQVVAETSRLCPDERHHARRNQPLIRSSHETDFLSSPADHIFRRNHVRRRNSLAE